jgi:metal-responsive CopG/Arc/MetJ family transcriptional regulator
MFAKNVVKLDPALLDRAKAAAEKAGYSSMEEFIRHAVEKELGRIEEAQGKEEVMKQLKGLGYLE